MSTLLRYAVRIFCILSLGALAAGNASADTRVALIIGNAKYEHADTLANTVNDANAIATLLTNAGFNVVDERKNVGVVEFKRAVREFLNAAANADIAVVYYSGHGIEIGGVNYLIPVDAKLANDFDVDDEAIPLDRLMLATQGAKKLSLIILDACRDNPFLRAPARASAAKRSVANRLVGVEPTSAGTLIAYAAKAGSVSYDGNGANSPFTTALVKYIAQPGLDIRIALGKVRDDVLASTGKRQEPFVYGSLGGTDISLVPAPPAPRVAATPAADSNASVAADYEMAERVGSRQGWQAFLAAHESGYYASLARAQITKLSVGAVSGPADASAANKKLGATAGIASKEGPPQPPDSAPEQKPGREAALQTVGANEPATMSAEQICKAEATRLAQLRLNPTSDKIIGFSHDLTCKELRPQVKRLMESFGLEPLKTATTETIDSLGEKSIDIAQACKRDAAELARIRANLDRESAIRFARELKCEDLRAQAARLLDSVGN